MPTEEKLIGVKALADALGFSGYTIYQMVSQGRIPFYRRGPLAALRFDLEEVRNALRQDPPAPGSTLETHANEIPPTGGKQ